MKRQTCPYCGTFFPKEELVRQQAANREKVHKGAIYEQGYRFTCPTCGRTIIKRPPWGFTVVIFVFLFLIARVWKGDFDWATWVNVVIGVIGMLISRWYSYHVAYFKKSAEEFKDS